MVHIGTSGYQYAEWRGSFYPEKMPEAGMLAYYAERLSSVEINYTFYRMPNSKTLAGWAETTPEHFTFSLKAPKRITHTSRLEECQDAVLAFYERARVLGPKLGIVLYQLPPFLRKNTDKLSRFLGELPKDVRAAFEFRHASWFDDEVLDTLRSAGAALCVSDSEKLSAPVVATAPFGYFRLRDEGYAESDLEAWGNRIRGLGLQESYVYFKHEEAGKGAEFARYLSARFHAGDSDTQPE